MESSETEELEGVETERSSKGTASSASDGETLGEGDSGRCTGEVRPLIGALDVVFVIVCESSIVTAKDEDV